jgi:enamine deaminase RidA (YjgF/YER057c/UK114 family)
MMIIFCPLMAWYGAVNKVFAETVKTVPARAFLEVAELGEDLMIDFYFFSNAGRDAQNHGAAFRATNLRVESISCWAAATIGPYAQAVEVTAANNNSPADGDDGADEDVASTAGAGGTARRVVVSGRIGMVPHTLELVTCSKAPAVAALFASLANATARELAVQFCFMYANSISALEHFGLSAPAITEVTFFLRESEKSLSQLLPRLWWLCAGTEVMDGDRSSDDQKCVRARLWIVSAMPKNALVEMVCVAAS